MSADSQLSPSPPKPLAGVRVVDLTRVMTGPYSTMMLGDLGADVIKVELPGKGDDTRAWGPPFVNGESAYYLSINRNKRSIALDLKSDAGKDALWRLIEGADVLVENFSPGAIARLGFGYDAVKTRNPKIIFASISGFGQNGPGSGRTAYDLIVQGMSGMMSVTGEPGGMPTKLGIPIADIGAGMFAAYAVAAALFSRERTGEGQYIDVSMLGGQVAMLTYQAGLYFTTGQTPRALGNGHPIVCPYDTFRTADGHVNIAVGNDSLWIRFANEMAMTEAGADPKFATNAGRLANKAELYGIIDKAFSSYTTAEIVAKLDARGVPAGAIYTVPEVFADPQAIANRLQRTIEHPVAGEISLTGFPYRFAGADLEITAPPPLLGQQTTEILREADYTKEEIETLLASGAASQS